jgi:hypothetical protein
MTAIHRVEPIVVEESLEGPFVVAGDHAYLIGRQDGSFPDMGWHVKGEMGGLWAHPIKLLDGFWLRVSDAWLTSADRFRVGPFWAEQEYELDGLRVVRHAFVPDTESALVVRYTLTASSGEVIPLRFLARTDLRDVWPAGAEENDSPPDIASYLSKQGVWSCRSAANDWYVIVGARDLQPLGHAAGRDLWGPESTAGHGISVALDYELALESGEPAELEFVVAGSHLGSAPALGSHRRVSAELPDLRRAKEERYEELLARSGLHIPEPSIERAWNWVKCNFDWLVRAVQPWGRGLGAGIDDYPWWFGCDNGYALRGCLGLGQHDIAIDTLDLLRRLSEAANGESGRVIHEANTRGQATDRGRTEETPHFVRTVWDTFLWTGDLSFLQRNYDFCKRGLLGWTLGEQTPEAEVLPHGYGVMEMLGLNLQCIDTASLTVEALVGLAGMARVLGDTEVADRCRALAETTRTRMEEAFWMEPEGLYGDMVATPAEMAPRLQHWLSEAKEKAVATGSFDSTQTYTNPFPLTNPPLGGAVEILQELLEDAEGDPEQARKRPWLLKNWSILCPLEGGVAPRERALRTLDRAEGVEFTGPWGTYICGTYRSYMMSISTGVMASAEAEYGRSEQALGYIRMLTDTLEVQMPGAIAEMSPDFGCFVQAWSGYAVAWPVVSGLFGVNPDAFHRRIELTPSFPSGWSEAQLTNLMVGTNRLDLRWDGTTLWVTSHEPGWDIRCDRLPMRLEQSSEPPRGG